MTIALQPDSPNGELTHNDYKNKVNEIIPAVNSNSEKKNGVFDYNDVTTATTPILITGGAGFTFLTNDGAGAATNKLYPPVGVTDVWNASTNEFDFSQLTKGSKVSIRIDLLVTTLSPNTQIDIALELGIGISSYDIQWVDVFEKSAGDHRITVSDFIYIGDDRTQSGAAKFKIEADGNCDVKVNGWACYINMY